MNENKWLIAVVVLLTVSVISTGILAVNLTLSLPTDAAETTSSAGQADAEPLIAFISDRQGTIGVYAMNGDGSQVELISNPELGFCFTPAWSPDGQSVAYWGAVENPFDGTGDASLSMWISTADGSQHIQVSEGMIGNFMVYPAWSSDGEWLAFAGASADGGGALYIAAADGSAILRSIQLPWEVRRLKWSPTGQDLLVSSITPTGASNIYRWSSEQAEMLDVFGGAEAADWSPDGEEIVVGDLAAQLVAVVGSDGEAHQVSSFAGSFPLFVSWSPDGEHIAVGTALARQRGFPTSLYVVNRESGTVSMITDNEGWILDPSWSPDGTSLLFTLGEDRRRPDAFFPFAALWSYNLAAGELTQVTLEEDFSGWGVWTR